MNERTPSTNLRAITRLYKEADELWLTDPVRAAAIAEDARQRLLSRPLRSVLEQRKLADLLLLLAYCEDRIATGGRMLEYATEALHIFENIGAAEGQAHAVNSMGIAHWKRGEFTAAYEHFVKCLELLRDESNPSLEASASGNLGMICWYLGHYPRALQYMKGAIALYEELKRYDAVNLMLQNLGNLYSSNGDVAEALKAYFRGISIIETHCPEMTINLGQLLTGIGSVFLLVGEYDKALEYYLRGLAIMEKADVQAEVALVLQNIGLVYRENNALETAREYLAKSLALRERLNDHVNTNTCLTNLASVSLGLGRPEEALAYAQRSIGVCKEYGDRRVLSYALHAAGQASIVLGDQDAGIALLTEGLAVCRELQYNKGEIEISQTLGAELDRMGQHQEALAYLQGAFTLARDGANNPLLLRIHRLLAELHKSRGELAEALEHSNQAYELNNTIFNEQSERRMQALQVAHRVEEAQKEAEIYRLKTEQLERTVQERDREVAAKTMHLSQRMDFLQKVKKMLSSALAAPQEELRKSVRQVMAVVDGALADDDAWHSFEEHFQQVHPTFVETLRARWPELSAVELRVCSLMRLNLSSKEICRILNIAPRSVDMYRYRIRKKLGMGSEENLSVFLAGIA